MIDICLYPGGFEQFVGFARLFKEVRRASELLVEAHRALTDSEDFALLAGPWGPMAKEAVVRHCRRVRVSEES